MSLWQWSNTKGWYWDRPKRKYGSSNKNNIMNHKPYACFTGECYMFYNHFKDRIQHFNPIGSSLRKKCRPLKCEERQENAKLTYVVSGLLIIWWRKDPGDLQAIVSPTFSLNLSGSIWNIRNSCGISTKLPKPQANGLSFFNICWRPFGIILTIQQKNEGG